MDCFPKPLLADREMILFTFSSVFPQGVLGGKSVGQFFQFITMV